jgi:hypothetical protein
MTTALRIPDRLAHTVVSAFGDVGRDWLAQLPSLVAEAASAWQLQVGVPFEPGGNVGWVAPVRRADGTDAVLKVECPGHRNPWAVKGLQHPRSESTTFPGPRSRWSNTVAVDDDVSAGTWTRPSGGEARGDSQGAAAVLRTRFEQVLRWCRVVGLTRGIQPNPPVSSPNSGNSGHAGEVGCYAHT